MKMWNAYFLSDIGARTDAECEKSGSCSCWKFEKQKHEINMWGSRINLGKSIITGQP